MATFYGGYTDTTEFIFETLGAGRPIQKGMSVMTHDTPLVETE